MMRTILDQPAVVIAVDPGLSGAVARVGMGIIEVRRDFKKLDDIVVAIKCLSADNLPKRYIMEQVGARPGQGVCSMFSFGKSTGVALGTILAWSGKSPDEVAPLKWQNWVRKELKMEKKEPFDSRLICQKLFPEHLTLLKRKKDHNTADAILMGLYKLSEYMPSYLR